MLKAGDRVRFHRADEAIPGHGPEDGAMGTVQRVNGEAVVVQLDQPFEAAGLTMHTFHSYARELEPIARVGKLGGEDLFADDEDAEHRRAAGYAASWTAEQVSSAQAIARR